MRIRTYDGLRDENSLVSEEAFEIGENIFSVLGQKYGRPCTFPYEQLSAILRASNGNLEGKKILDLGCGSKTSKDNIVSRSFEPWFCRTLVELGAKPIGIDIEPKNGEVFEYHQADLIDSPLAFIESSSIDIAHASDLFDSPRLYRELIKKNMDFYKFSKSLKEKLQKVVKPEGIFIHNYRDFL